MDINVKVTIDASPEFMAVLQGLLKPAGMHAVPASTPAGNKGRKPEKAAEKVQEPAEVETSAEAQETVSGNNQAATPSVTIEQIRALIPEKKAQVGMDKLKALLTKYNTANVTNLPMDKYDEFYNELKNLAA